MPVGSIDMGHNVSGFFGQQVVLTPEGAVSIQRPTAQSSGKGSGTRISILKEVSSCGSQAEKLRSATIVPWSEYFCDQGEAAHWLDD